MQRLSVSEYGAAAQARLQDAEKLIKSGSFSLGCYACGLAVECAVKALLLQNTDRKLPQEHFYETGYISELKSLKLLDGFLNAKDLASVKNDANGDRRYEVATSEGDEKRAIKCLERTQKLCGQLLMKLKDR